MGKSAVMPVSADGWSLAEATENDLRELMGWFADARAVNEWGGPRFRYPYTWETFREDCHWEKMATYRLNDPRGRFVGFGQLYKRYDRINLARLVVHPERRGAGVGKRLVALLLLAGPGVLPCSEFSLFVFRDNIRALECYRSMGFVIRDYPSDAPMPDQCYYLTRPVEE
jgi:ribosomal protein S18 acetylase RimI-like enzyme